LLLAWETVFPDMGRLPVTWQTLDIAKISVLPCPDGQESATLYQKSAAKGSPNR
jgi:hypothetical protein